MEQQPVYNFSTSVVYSAQAVVDQTDTVTPSQRGVEQQSVITNSIPGVHCVHTGIGGAQDGQESDSASQISDSLSRASESGDLRESENCSVVKDSY